MSRIMELADKYATMAVLLATIPKTQGIVSAVEARAALAAEVEQLQRERQAFKDAAEYTAKERDALRVEVEKLKATGDLVLRGTALVEAELRAQLAAAQTDAEQLDWLERKLFVRTWNGVIDSGSNTRWRVADGDYRRMAATMNGDTFRAAIDAAMKGQQ